MRPWRRRAVCPYRYSPGRGSSRHPTALADHIAKPIVTFRSQQSEVRARYAESAWRLSSLSRADTLIVPGMADLDQSIPDALLRAIRRSVDRQARVASICTGAFVLAATGALDGLRATTHWLGAPIPGHRRRCRCVAYRQRPCANVRRRSSSFRPVSSPRATGSRRRDGP